MTTAADPAAAMSAPDQPERAHPRTRSMETWRARKAVLASRGEVDGPRVQECSAALSWWRTRTFLVREMSLTEERADSLLDLIDRHADAAQAESADAAAESTTDRPEVAEAVAP